MNEEILLLFSGQNATVAVMSYSGYDIEVREAMRTIKLDQDITLSRSCLSYLCPEMHEVRFTLNFDM